MKDLYYEGGSEIIFILILIHTEIVENANGGGRVLTHIYFQMCLFIYYSYILPNIFTIFFLRKLKRKKI